MDGRPIKIVGERNSGTNVLAAVLAGHTDGRLVRSAVPGPVATLDRRLDIERFADAYFALTSRSNGGWKHAHAGELRRSRLAPDVGVAIIVRDPWSWLVSMFRRPYHWPRSSGDFAEFLEAPVTVVGREGPGPGPAPTPVDVWNWKASGYLDLVADRPRTAIVRYEDLVLETAVAIRRVAAPLGLGVISEPVLPMRGVKHRDREVGADDYRQQLIDRRHAEVYDAATESTVAARLDRSLLDALQYSARVSN